MRKGFSRFYISTLRLTLSLVSLFLNSSSTAFADPRARYDSASDHIIRTTPIVLDGDSRLTVISPDRWTKIGNSLSTVLTETYTRYQSLFGTIPVVKSSVRLMEEEEFFSVTGAPRWTNALFYKGQIIIPLSNTEPIDMDNLRRSAKHEFTHAIISSLSSGRAPGWLDEGLAQWSEGSENPALQPALRAWLTKNEPLPLSLLQGGFTRLNANMVPAAYAQSLYATYVVIHGFGFERLGKYMGKLRAGETKTEAFVDSFGVSENKFESTLGYSLRSWLNSDTQSPHETHLEEKS